DGSVAFGHRRLSIVDLSPAGHQPMTSRNGAWTITYNGELYNTAEIQGQLGLTSADLRGHSDTEVLLEAISRWGVETTVRRVVGMFGFAAYDHQKGDVWLARDRFGEKPLYYQAGHDRFAFASELSAIMSLPGPRPDIDRGALTLLLRHGYIPAPHSVFEGVSKLPAGHILRVTTDGHVSDPVCYWNPIDEARDAPKRTASKHEVIDELEELLSRTVASRTVSDVPLGAFLSGGIDSSLVVALMARVSSQPPRTFTIGFEETSYDESPFAKRIAHHLGTDHTELIVSESDALSIVPKLSNIYSEPFADSSQIPTRLVSELARQSVTVALSGDGGDELFAGYSRYQVMRQIDFFKSNFPTWMARSASFLLENLGAQALSRVSNSPSVNTPSRQRSASLGRKLERIAGALRQENTTTYESLISFNFSVKQLVAFEEDSTISDYNFPNFGAPRTYMLHDTLHYLPEDLLTKVDRASMSVGLEVRAPFLDPDLFRFAHTLPSNMQMNRRRGKLVLRGVLARYVPSNLFERPKMGFGVPLGLWLSGPLQLWASELLDPSTMLSQGYLQSEAVTALWNEHSSGRTDRSAQLWPILMFQSWLNEWAP
ncbi:MAG: asparagine synthase (glutamine-hydrolyzing), partial [Actinomycetota bacterium]|nr:asparagine synthase (glutamine-hydrolyzing) [Actinomycetota bacterium]